MAYNEKMADRVRELIAEVADQVEEKKMFGGLCFMVNGKMCVAVRKTSLMARIDPGITAELLEKEGVVQMIHGDKLMPGFIYIDEDVVITKKHLHYWIKLALEFNAVVTPAKKRK